MKVGPAASALVSLACAACTVSSPPRDPDDAPADARRISASGWVATTDDVRVRYHQNGSGPATLVFVHGWLCDSRYWRLQVPEFEERYRVVTLDLAGHGESGFGRERWTMQAFAQDVATVVRATGAEQVVLIGHSMGGPVVVEAARLLPGRVIGVVGVDTLRATYFEPPPAAQRAAALAPFRADFVAATRNFVGSTLFAATSDPALRASITADMAEGPSVVGIGALEGLLDYDLVAGLEQLPVPLVVINSDYEPTDRALIENAARDVRFESIGGVGHFVMLEAPAEFNAVLDGAVARFLAAAASSSGP